MPRAADRKPRDPTEERWDAVWKEFESREGEDRKAVFLRTLDDKELMTDDAAFEMLSRLHQDAALHGERARFVRRHRIAFVNEHFGSVGDDAVFAQDILQCSGDFGFD